MCFIRAPRLHISETTLSYRVRLWSRTHLEQSGILSSFQCPWSDKYNMLRVVSVKWCTSPLCYFQIWWELQSQVVRGFGTGQCSGWSGPVYLLCFLLWSSGNIVLHTEGLLDNSLNLHGPLRVRGLSCCLAAHLISSFISWEKLVQC